MDVGWTFSGLAKSLGSPASAGSAQSAHSTKRGSPARSAHSTGSWPGAECTLDEEGAQRHTAERKSAHPDARVAEHPQPGALVLDPPRGPRHLDVAGDPLRVRHHRGEPAVGGRHGGEPVGRAVGVERIRHRRHARGGRRTAWPAAPPRRRRVRRSWRSPRRGRPRSAPGCPPSRAMKIEGDSSTSTSVRRASYCSERLRVKRGQASAPGMRSPSAANIWQPLQMPSPKVSSRWKKAAELLGQPLVEEHRAGPPLARPERVAVGEATAGHEPDHVRQVEAPGLQVGHVHVVGVEAGPVEGERRLDVAVDPLLAQDGDLRPSPERQVGRRDVVGRVEGRCHDQARVVIGAERAACSSSAQAGLSRSAAIRHDTSSQACARSRTDSSSAASPPTATRTRRSGFVRPTTDTSSPRPCPAKTSRTAASSPVGPHPARHRAPR